MNPRTYATRFLLIMTGILGFAVAQGPIYAGTLCECLAELEARKTCFEANTGAVTAVTVSRFPTGHYLQCTIQAERNVGGGTASLILIADRIGDNPGNQNQTYSMIINGLGPCPGGGTTIQNLSKKEQAAWASLASAECREAQ